MPTWMSDNPECIAAFEAANAELAKRSLESMYKMGIAERPATVKKEETAPAPAPKQTPA